MSRAWRLGAWFGRTALMAAAACFSVRATAEFLVVSQNTLHLGQGSRAVPGYIPAKNAYVRALAAWPDDDLPQLTFLQEVMAQAQESDIRQPGTLIVFGQLKGQSSYKERYAVLVRNDAEADVAVLCHVDTTSLVSAGVVMERPPDGILVRDSSGSAPQLIWLLNFHAVFGSNAGVRRAEAAEIGMIISRLRARAPAGCPATTPNVVAMGDWNLPATDRGFTDLGLNAGFARLSVSPNEPTSLNARGERASAYDHFVWDDALVQVTLPDLSAQTVCGTSASFAAGVLIPTDLLSFRQRCSDHLAIAAHIRVR